MASQNLHRPELVFDMDDLPMLFKADYEDDFVKMVYASEQETVGTYVPQTVDEKTLHAEHGAPFLQS